MEFDRQCHEVQTKRNKDQNRHKLLKNGNVIYSNSQCFLQENLRLFSPISFIWAASGVCK